jgi:hypothetical protein
VRRIRGSFLSEAVPSAHPNFADCVDLFRLSYPALYLALHLLEGYVLLPLIQRRAVHLPPALALVPQALMGEMQGALACSWPRRSPW